jgi:glycerol-3-phosphate acyltransferase PlsY
MSPITARLAFAAASYLLGSFPTGYLVLRACSRRDIRTLGSGATGATNVLRVSGWKSALPVALVDILKGALPAFLALRFFGDPGFAVQAASLAVLGHCFPVTIGFRGGKGVATAAGAMAALAPWPAAASAVVFAATVAATRYVSLGSLLAAAAFPAFALLLGAPPKTAAWSVAIVLVIVLRHAGNIRRLLQGRESRLGASDRGTT